MFKVYISNIGRVTEPLMQGIIEFCPDKVILLNSKNVELDANGNVSFDYDQMERNVIYLINQMGIKDIESLKVDVFDYHDVFTKARDRAYAIQDEYGKCFFRINITLGTNVAASAISNLAYHFPSEMFYSIKADPQDRNSADIPRLFDVESLDEIAKLRRLKRTVELLGSISEDNNTNEQLRAIMKISSSTLSHHLTILQSMGLVDYDGTRRNQKWYRTDKGNNILKRLS